jgi:hypothetical protein
LSADWSGAALTAASALSGSDIEASAPADSSSAAWERTSRRVPSIGFEEAIARLFLCGVDMVGSLFEQPQPLPAAGWRRGVEEFVADARLDTATGKWFPDAWAVAGNIPSRLRRRGRIASANFKPGRFETGRLTESEGVV